VDAGSIDKDLFQRPSLPASGCEQRGDRFGAWTLLKELPGQKYWSPSRGRIGLHRMWLARCNCGTEKPVALSTLRTGNSTQCRSCAGRAGKVEVKPGEGFGMWTIIEEGPGAESLLPSGKPVIQRRFWCRCVCDREFLVALNGLRSGQSTQCKPCAAKNRVRRPSKRWTKLTQRDAGLRQARFTYERTARDRGLAIDLSADDFEALLAGNCAYCGTAPANHWAIIKTAGRPYPGEQFVYSGIDRVDNAVGYVAGNCVSCCADCNRAKRKMGLAQFVAYIMRVALHMQTRPELLASVASAPIASPLTERWGPVAAAPQPMQDDVAVPASRMRRRRRSDHQDAQGTLLAP
jgi:hypothetical protein